MPIVVFDSSVLIPLIVKAGRSTRLVLRLEAAGWQVAVSPQLMAETREKMETKRSVREWLKMTDGYTGEWPKRGGAAVRSPA